MTRRQVQVGGDGVERRDGRRDRTRERAKGGAGRDGGDQRDLGAGEAGHARGRAVGAAWVVTGVALSSYGPRRTVGERVGTVTGSPHASNPFVSECARLGVMTIPRAAFCLLFSRGGHLQAHRATKVPFARRQEARGRAQLQP